MKIQPHHDPSQGASDSPRNGWTPLLFLSGFLILSAPSLLWYIERMKDGSDEPYGLLALLAWAAFLPVNALRKAGRAADFPNPFEWATAVATAAALLIAPDFPLIQAGILISALSLLAVRRGAPPAILGLGILSLPIIATLEFYCGYPLRYACGWLGVQVLNIFSLPVRIEGISMWIGSAEIVIDRPCSGLKYLWFGWFLTALIGVLYRLSLKCSISLSLLSGLILFLANALRINLLFLLEWRDLGGPVTHEWVGLLVFSLALLAILFCARILRCKRPSSVDLIRSAVGPAQGVNRLPFRIAGGAWCLLALSYTIIDQAAVFAVPHEEQRTQEVRFAASPAFAGEGFARLLSSTEGDTRLYEIDGAVVLLREIKRPSRSVHPAEDCFRGSGYSIEHASIWKDPYERNWRRFYASREGTRWEVRQRIEGADGRNSSDVSQWFWNAATGRSVGPWRMWVMIQEA